MINLSKIIILVTLFLTPRLAESEKHTCSLPGEYRRSSWIMPDSIEGDFDADGIADKAQLIEQAVSSKKGIAVCCSKIGKLFFLGAGSSIGAGGDDFNWMDEWALHSGPVGQGVTSQKPPEVKGDALFVSRKMSASAVIYYSDGKFEWYQQGD